MQLSKINNTFNHDVFGELTVITNTENEVFFISNQVSDILGYSSNKKLLERLDPEEKLHLNYEKAKALLWGHDLHSSGIQLLTESGLYSAILGSQKEGAKPFKKWVTSEVLPSIRKTGSYTIKSVIPDFTNPVIAARAWADEYEAKTIALKQKEEAEALVAEMIPKVEHFEACMDSEGAFNMSEAGQILGLGRNRLFQVLRELKICYRYGEFNHIYQLYVDQGYFTLIQSSFKKGDKAQTYPKILVTQKGIDFIRKKKDKIY